MTDNDHKKDDKDKGSSGLTISNPLSSPIEDADDKLPAGFKPPTGNGLSLADDTPTHDSSSGTDHGQADGEPASEIASPGEDSEPDTQAEPVADVEPVAHMEAKAPRGFAKILAIIGGPESMVRRAWKHSSARQYLLKNVDSLRIEDENQRMETVIEQTYGGALEKKFSPGRFIKNNILFSVLVLILLFAIGSLLVQNLYPEQFPKIPTKPVAEIEKDNARKAALVAQQRPVEINHINKVRIEETLSHCLVLPASREQFLSEFSKTGYQFSNRELGIAYQEVRGYLNNWAALNVDDYVRDSARRFEALAAILQPLLIESGRVAADYQASIAERRKQVQDLEQRIDALTTTSGTRATDIINQRIQLRNQLTEIQASLQDEPSDAALSVLADSSVSLSRILDGQQRPDRIKPDELDDSQPEWLTSLPTVEADQFPATLREQLVPQIRQHIDTLETAHQEVAAYHVDELTQLLEHNGMLAALVAYAPENMLLPFEAEIRGLDRRLNTLLPRAQDSWLSIEGCLAEARTASKSATVSQ
jgi:hypothetical protein